MLKYGMFAGFFAAFTYPLPYSVLFLMITVDINVPFVAIFMLAGMRSGAIALLLKYSFHFPKHVFHWIVFIFTILIGIFLPNSKYLVMLRLYFFTFICNKYILIFLSEKLAKKVTVKGPHPTIISKYI